MPTPNAIHYGLLEIAKQAANNNLKVTVLHPEFGRQFLTNKAMFDANFNSKDIVKNPEPFQRAYEWTYNARDDFDFAILPFIFYDRDLYGHEEHFVLAIYDKNEIYLKGVYIYDPKKQEHKAEHPFRKILRHSLSSLLPPNFDKLHPVIHYSQENFHEQDANDFRNSGYFILSYAKYAFKFLKLFQF